MRHGSLFSGIGGFDLAAEWMGWKNVFHCEINPFGQKVLHHYWPNAIQYSDITKTDFSKHEGTIDIISGGFPYQPYSNAGKRKGKEDERHLWPEMLRAIRQIQPRWIVGENVPGLLNWGGGLVLDEIKADLEASGFEVFTPLVLPACGKDAMHRRDRLWIVAHNKVFDLEKQEMVYTTRSISESGKSTERLPNNIWGFNRETYLSDMVGRVYGISEWVDRSKGLGNSIVPQVAYEIFRSIQQTDKIIYERYLQAITTTY